MPVMRTGFIAVPLLAATATLSHGCIVSVDSQAQIVREEKRFTVTGVPELRIATFDGAIEIRSWDRPEVVIAIEKRGPTKEAVDALEVRSSQQGERIELNVKQPRSESYSGGWNRSASARLVVSVPATANIIASSGDGSIRVERVSGRLELTTGDGSITASEVSGELTVRTGDGSVRISDARGRLDLNTGDGSVDVSGRLHGVKLSTSDGSIVLRAEAGTEMSSDWAVTTGDGAVDVYLPAELGADIDAQTGDGAVRSELKVSQDVEGDSDEDRRTLRGRVGSGGKNIRIRTSDGSIRLRPS